MEFTIVDYLPKSPRWMNLLSSQSLGFVLIAGKYFDEGYPLGLIGV
jgi:hypothetical protein